MSEQTTSPISWVVDGNLTPADIIALADTTPFSGTNATITITDAQTIDGHTLKAVKAVPNFPEQIINDNNRLPLS